MANKSTKSTKSTKSSSKTTRTSTAKAKPDQSTTTQSTLTATPEKIKKTLPRVNRSFVIVGIVVLVIAGLLITFRGFFVAATVNGQPITRLSVIQDLERQGGKQTLNSLVTKQLILQEAKKKNITVSEAEIDKEVQTISENFKKQGQTLDDVLTSQNLDVASLRDQLKIQKMIEKMLADQVTVSDAEVKDYMEKNAESLPETANEADIKEQLRQQKLNDKFQSFLADLQKNAKIRHFVNY